MDMTLYHLAGQPLLFPSSRLGLDCFEEGDGLSLNTGKRLQSLFPDLQDLRSVGKTFGWVGGAQRLVESYDTSGGMLLKVEGSREFFITPHGEMISQQNVSEDFTKLDYDVLLGPALVLALALRGTWSLHASAATFGGNTIVFLGESGQGKSTLAAYLSAHANWRLVADDILPVKVDLERVQVLPHFPQLKLRADAQPGTGLPEQLPLDKVCVLAPAGMEAAPQLQRLASRLAIQMLLRHTAGTRMLTPEMLGKHLEFCSQVANQIPMYRLTYPHRKDMLPWVRELLENLD